MRRQVEDVWGGMSRGVRQRQLKEEDSKKRCEGLQQHW